MCWAAPKVLVVSPSSGVLSELDLLGDDGKKDSGLISGDEDLLSGNDKEADDALAEDDLVIAADDDDLMLGSAGSVFLSPIAVSIS